MPKIFLKPNSAEYADKNASAGERRCDMPGCRLHGDHKAPRDRGLRDYYWFCLDHVREYNKAWNFFSGMSDREVEEYTLNSLYGDRPTWRYDLNGFAEDLLKRKAWQAYHFTDKEPPRAESALPEKTTPEFEAMAIMGLQPPVSRDALKERYRELAKKHHPDRNKGCQKSEEILKSINMAYTILKLAYDKFETLPDR